jgi:hypothetical protein
MGKTLLDKVWDLHRVRELPNGQTQLFIGLHLIHEVTSPQSFQMLREKGLPVAFPERTFATADHIIPTEDQARPFADGLAEEMMAALETNCRQFGVKYFDFKSGEQGIVHVVGPEQGLTQPGLTVACGDSHTSTHGAFGAIAFGVGTTQAGLGEPLFWTDDVHDALLARFEIEIFDAKLTAVGFQRGHHFFRQPVRKGTRLIFRRNDVIRRGEGAFRERHRKSFLPEHLKGLRARDFVDQVETDEQLGLPVGQFANPMKVPDFVEQCFSHHIPFFATNGRPAARAEIILLTAFK